MSWGPRGRVGRSSGVTQSVTLCSGIFVTLWNFLTYNEMFYAEFENHQVLPKAGLTY